MKKETKGTFIVWLIVLVFTAAIAALVIAIQNPV